MFWENYRSLRDRAKEFFDRNPTIRCPYFEGEVVLNAEGLHHLRYSAERERGKPEQMLKFRVLPLALEVIQKSGTVQEYRRAAHRQGWRGYGMPAAKEVDFVAIIGPRPEKIRVTAEKLALSRFWMGRLRISMARASRILVVRARAERAVRQCFLRWSQGRDRAR